MVLGEHLEASGWSGSPAHGKSQEPCCGVPRGLGIFWGLGGLAGRALRACILGHT